MKLNKIFIIIAISLSVIFVSPQAFGYGGGPEPSSSNNYTVEISADSESYVLGESIVFSGTVNKYDEERSLRITIFDSNSNLVVTQKTTVNEDYTFSHTIPLNQKFDDGKHIVKAQYGNTKATVAIMSFEITAGDVMLSDDSDNAKIPDFVKNNAGWWANGSIDDQSFVGGIQFLIEQGIMKIPPTSQGVSSGSNDIPDFVKNNAGWWANGAIDDQSFVGGIQFLIEQGIMKISN